MDHTKQLKLDEAVNTIIKYMNWLSDDNLSRLELRASQIMWDRYNANHPDDFNILDD